MPPQEMLLDLGLDPKNLGGQKFFRGAGCDHCNNTGYKGRVGLFELMIMNDDLRELVMRNATTDELRQRATKYGMIPLREYGLKYVGEGITTVDEVIRETVLEA